MRGWLRLQGLPRVQLKRGLALALGVLGEVREQEREEEREQGQVQQVQTHAAHHPFSVVVEQVHETLAGAGQPLPQAQSVWEQAWVLLLTSGLVQVQATV